MISHPARFWRKHGEATASEHITTIIPSIPVYSTFSLRIDPPDYKSDEEEEEETTSSISEPETLDVLNAYYALPTELPGPSILRLLWRIPRSLRREFCVKTFFGYEGLRRWWALEMWCGRVKAGVWAFCGWKLDTLDRDRGQETKIMEVEEEEIEGGCWDPNWSGNGSVADEKDVDELEAMIREAEERDAREAEEEDDDG